MGLRSTVFGFRGDPALEACLVRDSAHIKQGTNDCGNHVLKIQQALVALDRLSIDRAEIKDKKYGRSSAAAVLRFKTKRQIINFSYQTAPDNIVGKMTIARMDNELAHRFPFQPIDPNDLNFPPDIPVPPPPPPSPTSTHFKIRFLGGISAASGLAGDVIFFQIWDTTNNLAETYAYFGGGAGLSFPKLPLSATLAGPFKEFLTIKPVPVGIFAGPAHWTSGGGGPLTLNILQIFFIAGLASGVQMFVDTGLTVGIGASSTFGFMAPVSDAEPFHGG
jgi:hypothetical protein